MYRAEMKMNAENVVLLLGLEQNSEMNIQFDELR